MTSDCPRVITLRPVTRFPACLQTPMTQRMTIPRDSSLNLPATAWILATLASVSVYADPLKFAANTPDPATIDTPYRRVNDMPARYQWNANYGYCGEVSMISAGLYYGQYLSQYDMRAIASPGKKQNREDAQLLLGVNDAQAAKQLRLQYQRMASASDRNFYAWVKHEVAQGYPVITAVFNNEYLLYNDTRPLSGNPEYDHIVSVTGVGSKNPLMAGYEPEDVLLISDHGLYTPDGSAAYFYSLPIEQSLADRKTANMPDGFIYSLPAYPVVKYGIAITGVVDKYAETLPVRVSTSLNHETPEIKEGSNKRPAPMPLTLAILPCYSNNGHFLLDFLSGVP